MTVGYFDSTVMGVTEIPKLQWKDLSPGENERLLLILCVLPQCWELTHSQTSHTASPRLLNPKSRSRKAVSSRGTIQQRGRTYLACRERGHVPIKCGHRNGLEESTRGQRSVLLFHTRILSSLNDKQKLLFKRQGGTLGQQENSNETKSEKICQAETIRSPAQPHRKGHDNSILIKFFRFQVNAQGIFQPIPSTPT